MWVLFFARKRTLKKLEKDQITNGIPTGTYSRFLDINENGERRAEFLGHLKLTKASNEIYRQKNKENMQLAKKIPIKCVSPL